MQTRSDVLEPLLPGEDGVMRAASRAEPDNELIRLTGGDPYATRLVHECEMFVSTLYLSITAAGKVRL